MPDEQKFPSKEKIEWEQVLYEQFMQATREVHSPSSFIETVRLIAMALDEKADGEYKNETKRIEEWLDGEFHRRTVQWGKMDPGQQENLEYRAALLEFKALVRLAGRNGLTLTNRGGLDIG